MSTSAAAYRGRFAPSPTGPLHFGSLIAAVGSYLEARRHDGEWLVRMEDVDRPRTVAGAADDILRTLEAFGFEWDGPVLYQTARDEAYAAALDALRAAGAVYPCACSRKDAQAAARELGLPGWIYPGTCRRGIGERPGRSMRVLTADRRTTAFEDRLQGPVAQDLEQEVGDFVVRRADGLFAYQLAVVVDDAEQGITEVVRGSDLLESTPRQILLQQLLDLPTPGYLHLPVAVNPMGQKLSKQTHAPALDVDAPVPALWQALDFLGQAPPPSLLGADLPGLWAWAEAHWDPAAMPRRRAVAGPPDQQIWR